MLPWFHRTRRAYRSDTWMTRSGTFISYRSVHGGQDEPVTGKGTVGKRRRDDLEGKGGCRLPGLVPASLGSAMETSLAVVLIVGNEADILGRHERRGEQEVR